MDGLRAARLYANPSPRERFGSLREEVAELGELRLLALHLAPDGRVIAALNRFSMPLACR
jgi:hypothetical protein